ncbi:unnamed protein product, partial [Ectocarpus sp. 4 AP-2014]
MQSGLKLAQRKHHDLHLLSRGRHPRHRHRPAPPTRPPPRQERSHPRMAARAPSALASPRLFYQSLSKTRAVLSILPWHQHRHSSDRTPSRSLAGTSRDLLSHRIQGSPQHRRCYHFQARREATEKQQKLRRRREGRLRCRRPWP